MVRIVLRADEHCFDFPWREQCGCVVKVDRLIHSRVEIPLHETFRTAIRETDSISSIRVEIHAGDRVGVGYATATPAITGDSLEAIESHLDQVVSPYLFGRDIVSGQEGGTVSGQVDGEIAGRLEGKTSGKLSGRIDARPYVLGAQSNAVFGIPDRDYEDWTRQCSSGTAGVDLALHNLVFGASRSLGSEHANLVTSVTIGAGSIGDMVATAHRRVAAGFRVIKAKLGADPEHDAQRLIALAEALGATGSPEANVRLEHPGHLERGEHLEHFVTRLSPDNRHSPIRRGEENPIGRRLVFGPDHPDHRDPGKLGSVQLWIDANQGWTVAQALQIFDSALDANVMLDLFEQPTPAADLHGLREVRLGVQERCLARGIKPIPVVADESARTLADVDRIIAAGAADAINVKFMKFGGLTGSGIAVAKARAAGLGVLIGSMMEHPHSVAAAVRFASLLGGVHDLDAGWWAKDTWPLTYVDGYVSIASS